MFARLLKGTRLPGGFTPEGIKNVNPQAERLRPEQRKNQNSATKKTWKGQRGGSRRNPITAKREEKNRASRETWPFPIRKSQVGRKPGSPPWATAITADPGT